MTDQQLQMFLALSGIVLLVALILLSRSATRYFAAKRTSDSTTYPGPIPAEDVSAATEQVMRDEAQLAALERLYGVSRHNPEAVRRAVRLAMQEGGIRKSGGTKWGTIPRPGPPAVQPAAIRPEELIAATEQVMRDEAQLAALERLYGVSRNDHAAILRAITRAMQEGGIRRSDGTKWGG